MTVRLCNYVRVLCRVPPCFGCQPPGIQVTVFRSDSDNFRNNYKQNWFGFQPRNLQCLPHPTTSRPSMLSSILSSSCVIRDSLMFTFHYCRDLCRTRITWTTTSTCSARARTACWAAGQHQGLTLSFKNYLSQLSRHPFQLTARARRVPGAPVVMSRFLGPSSDRKARTPSKSMLNHSHWPHLHGRQRVVNSLECTFLKHQSTRRLSTHFRAIWTPS